MRVNIGMPVVRTGGRAVYDHVITKFSGMGRFTYPWCSANALRAPELQTELELTFHFFFFFSGGGAVRNLGDFIKKISFKQALNEKKIIVWN